MFRTLASTRYSSHGVVGSVFSIRGLLDRIEKWSAVARQRRQLAELDAERLRDIGLTPDKAAGEASRPFWDAPTGWRY